MLIELTYHFLHLSLPAARLLYALYAVCCLFVFRPGHASNLESESVLKPVQAHSRCAACGRAQHAGVPGGCEWIAPPLHKKGSAEPRSACSKTSKHRNTGGASLRLRSGLCPSSSHRARSDGQHCDFGFQVHSPTSTHASQARTRLTAHVFSSPQSPPRVQCSTCCTGCGLHKTSGSAHLALPN